MSKISEKYIEKVALFIRHVYDELNKGNKINFTDECIVYRINSRIPTAMIMLGIMKKIRNGRNGVIYQWNVGEPNINLARKVIEKVRKLKESNKQTFSVTMKLPEKSELSELPKVDTMIFVDSNQLKDYINKSVEKALAKPVKIRKVLRWRNPFYWKIK